MRAADRLPLAEDRDEAPDDSERHVPLNRTATLQETRIAEPLGASANAEYWAVAEASAYIHQTPS